MATHTLCRALRFLNYKRIISTNFKVFCVKNESTIFSRVTNGFSRISERTFSDIEGIEDPVKAKKKKVFVTRVNLLSETNEMTVVTLEEAQKIAKRRDFKLVKIVDFDAKSERAVYKLMKIHDFLQAESKSKAEAREARDKTIKEDKTISISSRISENDLNTKIKSIHKMLGKRHGVRVVVSIDGNNQKANEIRNNIMEKCGDISKAVTTSDTNSNLKVTLRPNLEKINCKISETDSSHNDDKTSQ